MVINFISLIIGENELTNIELINKEIYDEYILNFQLNYQIFFSC
jgi:hypothetical protein